MSIEQDLKRMADGIETIAKWIERGEVKLYVAGIPTSSAGDPNLNKPRTTSAPPLPTVVADPEVKVEGKGKVEADLTTVAVENIAPDDRKAIKEALDKLGVSYNPNLKTPTLREILNDEVVKRNPGSSVPLPTNTPKVVDPVPVDTKISLEDAKKICEKFAAVKGMQAFIDLLTKYGCKNLTAVKGYDRLDDFVKEVKTSLGE